MMTDAIPTLGVSAVGKANIVLSVGSDNVYRFGYNAATAGVYAPVDLTGWTAASQIRASVANPTVLLDMSSNIALTSSGDVTITVPAAATLGLETGGLTRGVWDLELTQTAGGRIVRLVEGSVTISQDVTRVVELV